MVIGPYRRKIDLQYLIKYHTLSTRRLEAMSEHGII